MRIRSRFRTRTRSRSRIGHGLGHEVYMRIGSQIRSRILIWIHTRF